MIQQVLNKKFLEDLATAVKLEVLSSSDDRRGIVETPMDDFTAAERTLLQGRLDVAHLELTSRDAASEGRRSGADVPLTPQEVNAYLARSPEVSNLQSAAERYYMEKRPDVVEPSLDGRRGEVSPLAGAQLTSFPEYLPGRRLFGAFEQTDLRWIGSWFAEGIRKFQGRHPFVDRPVLNDPICMPDENLRLIIVGDWGSGIPRAQKIGAYMRRELDSPETAGWQRHVIHLGDVYYSGWKYEYKSRFLDYWPVRPEEAATIGSFNLNGNHDMYSGGWDYYDFALADPRFKCWQGKSSLFSLANRRWQIFGLDTSHADGDLAGDQPAWIRSAALPGRQAIFLSHHQYCSSFEHAPAELIGKIDPVLRGLKVPAWFWGHEHRCMTFNKVQGIQYPSCVGHGGVPVYMTHDLRGPLPAPGKWEYREYVDGGAELWAKFGFITVDFYGSKIVVRYINEDGIVHRTDQFAQ